MRDNGYKVTIQVEDNSAKVKQALEENVDRVLYALGTLAVEGVVDYMSEADFTGRDIVDTGRLRASISFITPNQASPTRVVENSKAADSLKGNAPEYSTIIGTNVEYAAYVNNGTSKQEARRFLESGIDKKLDEMERMATKILQGEL